MAAKVRRASIRSSATDDLHADGAVGGSGTYHHVGTVPDSVPSSTPTLGTGWYLGLIERAAAEPRGHRNLDRLQLGGGTLLVNGNVRIRKGGALEGPGILVATGRIRVGRNAEVGAGVTLVAAKKAVFGQGVDVLRVIPEEHTRSR